MERAQSWPWEAVIGLSLAETLLAVALLLFVVDIFFQSDVPTLISYGLVATAVALYVDVHWLYRLTLALVVAGALAVFHYAVWRAFVERALHRFVYPTRFEPVDDRLVGAQGVIRRIDDRVMIEVNDELWPVAEGSALRDGESAYVVAREAARLMVVSAEQVGER